MSLSIRNLQTKGQVVVSYPADMRQAVERAVVSWKSFCSLPAEVKQAFPYSNSGAGVGYELKWGIGPKADRKENFDVALVGKQWLGDQLKYNQNSIISEFVKDAVMLVESVRPLILDFARQVEETFQFDGFVEEIKESEDAFFIRFIHYFGDREVDEEMAVAHTDQSGFTLHLFESAPGLQCLTFGGDWVEMAVSVGKTVIIPAMQLQLRSEGELKALCHRVVATPETAQIGRYAAVCFVQLKKTPKYDKEHWGRLQEKMPGFNYNLSLEEFQGFFKESV
jgi:isopenicillin N synthase-like dioxygenase